MTDKSAVTPEPLAASAPAPAIAPAATKKEKKRDKAEKLEAKAMKRVEKANLKRAEAQGRELAARAAKNRLEEENDALRAQLAGKPIPAPANTTPAAPVPPQTQPAPTNVRDEYTRIRAANPLAAAQFLLDHRFEIYQQN